MCAHATLGLDGLIDANETKTCQILTPAVCTSRCRSQDEGRPEELDYHNISVKYYILFLMTAKHRFTITETLRVSKTKQSRDILLY